MGERSNELPKNREFLMKWRRVNFIRGIPLLPVAILLLWGILVKISLSLVSLSQEALGEAQERGIDY
jgi:hypothetical protein